MKTITLNLTSGDIVIYPAAHITRVHRTLKGTVTIAYGHFQDEYTEISDTAFVNLVKQIQED